MNLEFSCINTKISRYKKAFTLMEVLITLAIIGVVAALTIPSLITNMQNEQMKAQFRKAYSTLAQAYNQAITDNNGNGFGNYTCMGSVVKWNAIKPYMRIIRECTGNTLGNCWAPNGITTTSGAYYTGGCPFSKDDQNNTLAFVTADGTSWLITPGPCDGFIVDVNGAKGPNQWGKDAFTFVMNDKNMQLGGCTGDGPAAKALVSGN